MKNKKTSQVSLIILVLITISYLGFQYYDNYKKKEHYKNAIITELQNGLLYIETNLTSDIHTAQKKTDQLFKEYLEELPDSKEEIPFLKLKYHITRTFMSIIFVDEYFYFESWRSAQQSEILSQFSMYELNGLNKAYNEGQKLIASYEELQRFGFTSTSFYHPLFTKETSKQELLDVSRKYHRVLFDNLHKVQNVGYAYSEALKRLDPENKYLKQIDSLRTKRIQKLQGN